MECSARPARLPSHTRRGAPHAAEQRGKRANPAPAANAVLYAVCPLRQAGMFCACEGLCSEAVGRYSSRKVAARVQSNHADAAGMEAHEKVAQG